MRKVEIYFEDAFPDLERRWSVAARDNLDVEIAAGTGATLGEASEELGAKLLAIRTRKRELKRSGVRNPVVFEDDL